MRVHAAVNAVLLSDWPKDLVAQYLHRVQRHSKAEIDVRPVKLKDPTDYLGIYRAADATLENLVTRYRTDEIAIHTSPGTSAMAAVWILLAKTKYAGAQLFKSWLDKSGQPQLASGGVKERAAKLVGVASRQALSHRMRRLGIGS
jgi:sigma54-dependent transcription regulator